MFAGSQIITSKLVHRSKRKEIIEAQNEDKITKDLVNMAIIVPRPKAAIVVETLEEKIERKALAQERRHERYLEQQKIVQHMEDLMEKVLRETPLSKKDEEKLRNKVKTIIAKVNKDSDKIDVTARHPSLIELPSSTSTQISSDSAGRSSLYSKPLKPTNQGAFLLWYDKNFN